MKKYIWIPLLLCLAFIIFAGCDKSGKITSPTNPEDLYRIDSDQCLNCGQCADVCPYNAIFIRDGKMTINQAKCQRCGECVDVCPEQAIR